MFEEAGRFQQAAKIILFKQIPNSVIMGLFSFLKGKGKKVVEDVKSGEVSKEEAAASLVNGLKKALDSYGLTVEDLDLQAIGDKIKVSGKVDTQAIKEKVVLVLGNVEGVATVEDHLVVDKPEPEATFYEVKSGDSLSKIAKEVYGNAMKYDVIFEANKPMLKDPNKIYPGQVLRIPPLEQ